MKKNLLALTFVVLGIAHSYAQYSVSDVKNYYAAKQTEFNLYITDLNDFIITDQYTDKHNGVTHVYIRQRVNGIEIYDANSNLHIDRNGKLITLNNSFISNAAKIASNPNPQIGTQSALVMAAADVQMNVTSALSKTSLPLINNELIINDKTVSPEPIKMALKYILSGDELKLAYAVELFNNETNDWWTVKVDANDGSIIGKDNYTVSCNFNKEGYVHQYDFSAIEYPETESILQSNRSMKTGEGLYNVVPLPFESPIHGARQLVTGSATNNGSPFGWHDTDGVSGADFTITRGNNVFSYDDKAKKNVPGFSPNGTSALVFDFPHSRDSTTKSNLSAAVTNLFYMNNVVHDIWYNYGFTEVAGNYQANNYGKGGSEHDGVKAEAQDGSGTNNANFSAPVDGQSGRMQMYIWPTATSGIITVNSPASITNYYNAVPAAFGPKKYTSITADMVLVKDSTGGLNTGCGAILNKTEIAGKIALVDRTTSCSYIVQVNNAQKLGAIAVIVIQSTSGSPTQMTGSGYTITIPSLMISVANGNILKSKLLADSSANITIPQFYNDSLDGDMDNGIIIHEYGHGVSIRLTGGPSNSSCLQNKEQGGEGWSDFFAMAFTAKAGDKPETGRGMGTYVVSQPVNGIGIRNYKYSTDMSINPMTYADVSNPSYFGEVHYIGTIWATVLWDLYWNMVGKYGWSADIYNGTAGNNKAIQLVIDGMKLQKCSPGFLDSRDAIIQADNADYGGANLGLIWRTFARRGMGYSASQGLSSSTSDQVAAFDIPPAFAGLTNSMGINQEIKIAPNPSTGQFYIMLPENTEKAMVTVTDISGKIILNELIKADLVNRIQLDLSNINNGIYFISVNSGSQLFKSKVVLTK